MAERFTEKDAAKHWPKTKSDKDLMFAWLGNANAEHRVSGDEAKAIKTGNHAAIEEARAKRILAKHSDAVRARAHGIKWV